MRVLLAAEAIENNRPDRTDHYLMALRGSWLKDWDGDFEGLKIMFGAEQPKKWDGRNLDEVPPDWTPPTKEEIAKAMGKSALTFNRIASKAKDERLM